MTPNLDQIIAFETGTIEPDDLLDLFSNLIQTGMAWTLQGVYGRTAHDLIEAGYLTPDGEILRDLEGS